MYKAKLCGFTIACMVGFVGISPITTFAAGTNTESVTLSETNKNQEENQKQEENKAAFEEKIKKANEKWNSLTTKQKNEVYSLLDDELQGKIKLMDKLVEFGIINKQDAIISKTSMLEKFKHVKDSGEFPLLMQKGKQYRK